MSESIWIYVKLTGIMQFRSIYLKDIYLPVLHDEDFYPKLKDQP
jgi:hypothetical protein